MTMGTFILTFTFVLSQCSFYILTWRLISRFLLLLGWFSSETFALHKSVTYLVTFLPDSISTGLGVRPYVGKPYWFVTLSLSLIPGRGGGRVTAPIVSRKFKMRRGSVGSRWVVEVEVRACVWAGQLRSRCCAVSSSPLQCGHNGDCCRPIRCR